MPLPGKRGHDLSHVANKAHVEHPVGFVHDQRDRGAENHVFAAEEVKQPSRRRHENIDATAQGGNLFVLVHAAYDDRVAKPEVPAVGSQALIDLDGEFPRGGEDQ